MIDENLNRAILDNDLNYLKYLTERITGSYEGEYITDRDLINRILNYNESEKSRCFICQKSVKNLGNREINICQECINKK